MKIPGPVTLIGQYAFCGCGKLNSIELPQTLASIENSAFRWCSKLASITIPDSVTLIDQNAFCGCGSLRTVSIPTSVTEIKYGAFGFCSNLVSIEVSESNEAFCSFDGIVYSKDRSALLICPSGKSDFEAFPENIRTIEKYAFYGCNCISCFDIPEGVQFIRSSAFYSCNQLRSVMLPRSTISFEKDSFDDCEQLKNFTAPEGFDFPGEILDSNVIITYC